MAICLILGGVPGLAVAEPDNVYDDPTRLFGASRLRQAEPADVGLPGVRVSGFVQPGTFETLRFARPNLTQADYERLDETQIRQIYARRSQLVRVRIKGFSVNMADTLMQMAFVQQTPAQNLVADMSGLSDETARRDRLQHEIARIDERFNATTDKRDKHRLALYKDGLSIWKQFPKEGQKGK